MNWRCGVAVVTFAAAASVAHAQGGAVLARPLWGGLQPGAHAVGFRVIQTHDHTRNYAPAVNYKGERASGQTARPMQIAVWYPARAATNAKPMTLGDYLGLNGTELGVDSESAARQADSEREIREGIFRAYYPNGVSDADWRQIQSRPVAAFRDVGPAAGKFPVLVHFMFGRVAQSPAMEFLASHGYVVLTVPLAGRSRAFWGRGEWSLTSIEAMVGDISFTLSEALKLPYADGGRVALIGPGTTPMLLYQMKSVRADAIVSIEGEVIEHAARHPSWDLTRVRVPLLESGSGEAPLAASLEAFKYSQRHLYHFTKMTHAESYPFQRYARPETAAAHKTYDWSWTLVLNFLNAYLKGDAAAKGNLLAPGTLGIPAGVLTARTLEASPAVPTEDEFLTLIRLNRLDEAARVFEEVRQREPRHRLFAFDAMRDVSVFLRRDYGLPSGIAAYKLLLAAYPQHGRAHSELAQLYQQTQDNAKAIEHYQKSLDLLEADKNMSEQAKAPLRQRLQQVIAQLKPNA